MADVDATRFLNVDLELVAAFGLGPLTTHLGENVIVCEIQAMRRHALCGSSSLPGTIAPIDA